MRTHAASAIGLALTVLLASSLPSMANDDVSAAAEMLRSLDSMAPVPPDKAAVAQPAPPVPRAPAPKGLSVTTLQPHPAQPRTGIISQHQTTSTENLTVPLPAGAARPTQPSRQVYTLQAPPPAAPANAPAAVPQQPSAAQTPPVEQPSANATPPALDDDTTTETLPRYRSAPRPLVDPSRTVSVILHTSRPQRLATGLGISVVQTGVHGRQLSAAASVINEGRTPLERIALTFTVPGGSRQHVRIPELRAGQSRSIKVRLRIPRGNPPDAIQVTTTGSSSSFATAGNEESAR